MLCGAIMFNLVQVNIKYLIFLSALFLMAGPSIVAGSHTGFKEATILFNIFVGFGSGMAQILCLQCLWEHAYSKRGYIAGFV